MTQTLIKQTLTIHDGEERPLSLLLIYAFFVGITLASFFAASSGLFLSIYSANTLPYVYITAAIVSSFTGAIYSLFKKYLSLARLLYITQIFLLISTLAFWIGLQSTRAHWAAFGVLVWFTILTALIHVAFWGLATRLFDVRQGKRLFGLVGAGEMVASVISGFATPLFVQLWGTIHLLLVAVIGLIGSLVVLLVIVRTYTHQIQATALIANKTTASARELLKTPCVRRIFILYVFKEYAFHSTAISALVMAKDEALPILTTTFEDSDTTPDDQMRIAQVLGRIKGPHAIARLERHLNTPDGNVRTQLLQALYQCSYRAENIAVIQYIRTEIGSITDLLACLVDIGNDSALNRVRRACFEEIDQGRQRCFYLLSFLYDATTISRARENLQHPAPQQKAYALEVLHTTLAHELSTLILPICESITSAQRLKLLREHFPQTSTNSQERLYHIASQTNRWMSPWLRANALYNLTDHTNFATVLFDQNDLVRETAMGKLFQAVPNIYQQYAAALKQDPNIRISRTAQHLERWAKGGQSVLLTIEKVMVLKSVQIFANASEDVLASLAPYLNEINMPSGENVYEKGGLGDTLYIIFEGQIRVHDGENTTFVLLEERDFFGELTTLDPQPHAATTTAVEDTRLLALDRDTLYELMSDYPEMLKSIVHILCQRLRGK